MFKLDDLLWEARHSDVHVHICGFVPGTYCYNLEAPRRVYASAFGWSLMVGARPVIRDAPGPWITVEHHRREERESDTDSTIADEDLPADVRESIRAIGREINLGPISF